MTEPPKLTVIIPAHNEEAVIGRTLSILLKDAAPGEFEVIVVCNGCSDATAETARAACPSALVVEQGAASKTEAINTGLKRSRGVAVLLLDADIELETAAARTLAHAAQRPGMEVAIGRMAVDLDGADFVVRGFYRVWMQHPYIRNGKFAAAIALSQAGLKRVGSLPPVTADDTYLRRLFPAQRVAVAGSVQFRVRAPRTTPSLVRVRARSYRGTRELSHWRAAPQQSSAEKWGLLRHVVSRPLLWPCLPAYVAVTVASRCLSYGGAGARWERDLTTRKALAD